MHALSFSLQKENAKNKSPWPSSRNQPNGTSKRRVQRVEPADPCIEFSVTVAVTVAVSDVVAAVPSSFSQTRFVPQEMEGAKDVKCFTTNVLKCFLLKKNCDGGPDPNLYAHRTN